MSRRTLTGLLFGFSMLFLFVVFILGVLWLSDQAYKDLVKTDLELLRQAAGTEAIEVESYRIEETVTIYRLKFGTEPGLGVCTRYLTSKSCEVWVKYDRTQR